MPITILDSDLAYAAVDGGRLALRFEGETEPPGYYLVRRSAVGEHGRVDGPFEHEDEALAAAERAYGPLVWSAH